MTNHAYITSVGAFLPGEAVSNDEMEGVLGLVGGKRSRYRSRILKSNEIKSRHYAMRDGKPTHLNEELAAAAVLNALERINLTPSDIGFLATGTTLPDLLIPGFAPMVHGRLGGAPMETLSSSGVCCAGMGAMKAAFNSIKCGDHQRAVAVGSENASAILRGTRFETESVIDNKANSELGKHAYFNADFLRWMLSDGAGAVVIEDKPRENGLALKIEWISMRSYANELPACMYSGVNNSENIQAGDTWLGRPTVSDAERKGMLVCRQDVGLLKENIARLVGQEASRLQGEGLFNGKEIDHFLAHYSSGFFEDILCEQLVKENVDIPKERWFSNLYQRGNTGAASIFIMLEEAITSGVIKAGENILLMVPESGRFSYSYTLLTCLTNPYTK